MEKGQIYRCSICGNIVEVLHFGGGILVCCGKPMELLQAKTENQGMEKHVPVIEESEGGVKVKVGLLPHPMEEGHYIEWIAIWVDGKIDRQFLKPGDAPEAFFAVKAEDITKTLEYCNVHGLWKSR